MSCYLQIQKDIFWISFIPSDLFMVMLLPNDILFPKLRVTYLGDFFSFWSNLLITLLLPDDILFFQNVRETCIYFGMMFVPKWLVDDNNTSNDVLYVQNSERHVYLGISSFKLIVDDNITSKWCIVIQNSERHVFIGMSLLLKWLVDDNFTSKWCYLIQIQRDMYIFEDVSSSKVACGWQHYFIWCFVIQIQRDMYFLGMSLLSNWVWW